HVQARRDAVAGERLLLLEPVADRGEHRHLPVRPLDPPFAFARESEVFHVVAFRRCHRFLSIHAASNRSCFRCSHSTHARSSAPASQPSTAFLSSGSRLSRAAKTRSEISRSNLRRSSPSDRSWFSSRNP